MQGGRTWWQVGRAQSLSHVPSSISCARRAVDSVGLRSLLDLLTCASERAMRAGRRAASGVYADAQALQSLTCALALDQPMPAKDSILADSNPSELNSDIRLLCSHLYHKGLGKGAR